MAKTVVGLFDTFAEAQNVVQELVDRGFAHSDISVVANDARSDFASDRAVGEGQATAEGAGAGAIGGTVIGGVLGLLVGTGLLVIPGIGPVLAAGPLAAAIGSTALGAGLGAAAGSLVGALVSTGVPEEDANYYAEGIRRGGTLVSVRTEDHLADEAYDVMQRAGAVDIRERGAGWRESGWKEFDPTSEPFRVRRDDEPARSEWEESSKVGTAGGTVAGAATGAAIGAAGGPVGAVIGGVAGAATGAGVGAAGDAAGEAASDRSRSVSPGEDPANWHRNPTGYDAYDADFRAHYQSHFGSSGYPYDRYLSVYHYGYNLATDPRYRNAEWSTIEPEARRNWEEHNPNTWEQFKDAVQYAWDKARGRR